MSASPCACCDEPLARVRYFPRQLLTADDMRTEQEFVLGRQRRHNRFLHGFGVTCGLEVKLPPGLGPEDPKGSKVWVCPGYAVSPPGDDILLDEPVLFDLATGHQEPEPCCQPWPCPPVGTAGESRDRLLLWLVVRYAECLTRPVRVPMAGCGCGETACDYSRIRESFELRALCALPESHKLAHEADQKWQSTLVEWRNQQEENRRLPVPVPACANCPEDPWVVLATILAKPARKTGLEIIEIRFDDRRVLWSTTALQLAILP